MNYEEKYPNLECFVCFQDESIKEFINSKICKCSGSLKLHQSEKNY